MLISNNFCSTSHIQGGISIEHEYRRDMLNTIACVSGFKLPFPLPLPDGSYPDVMQVSVNVTGFFIGDAKHTERPGSSQTIHRLENYTNWLYPISENKYWHSIFAICHGRPEDSDDWLELLINLTIEAELPVKKYGIKQLADDGILNWITIGNIQPKNIIIF